MDDANGTNQEGQAGERFICWCCSLNDKKKVCAYLRMSLVCLVSADYIEGSTGLESEPHPQDTTDWAKMETIVLLGWSRSVGKGLKISLHDPKYS